jgi:hypothetical protein
MANQIEARYGVGALLLNEKIPDITQTLSDDSAMYYGGRHFVCETIFKSAAKTIAEAMGWTWIGTEPFTAKPQEEKHYNWVPACGGKETPFKGRDGKTYLYMWNGVGGEKSEHAYYCQEDDLFLEYGECVGRVYPEA